MKIEFSTAFPLDDRIVFEDKVIAGNYESRVYNPLNMDVNYQFGQFGWGIGLNWLEYTNNFYGLEVDPYYSNDNARSGFSTYIHGGYDRSQLACLINFSYSFFEERILSVRLGIGAGHHFSNHLRNLTYRDIYQSDGITWIETTELSGNSGYSATMTYQAGLRFSSPQSWPVSFFVEASYLGNDPLWHASRLDFPDEMPGVLSPPYFGNHVLLLKTGFSFSIDRQIREKEIDTN